MGEVGACPSIHPKLPYAHACNGYVRIFTNLMINVTLCLFLFGEIGDGLGFKNCIPTFGYHLYPYIFILYQLLLTKKIIQN